MPDALDPLLPLGVTAAGFRARVGAARADDAEQLADHLAGAASMAAALTRRNFVAEQGDDDDPVTKVIAAAGRTFIRVPDLRDVVSIVADGRILGVDDVELRRTPATLPGPAAQIVLPWPVNTIAVTGRFGWTEIPPLLVDAIYAHAGRNFREREALYADSLTVGAGDGGGAIYSYFRQLPPRVRVAYDLFRVASDWYGL